MAIFPPSKLRIYCQAVAVSSTCRSLQSSLFLFFRHLCMRLFSALATCERQLQAALVLWLCSSNISLAPSVASLGKHWVFQEARASSVWKDNNSSKQGCVTLVAANLLQVSKVMEIVISTLKKERKKNQFVAWPYPCPGHVTALVHWLGCERFSCLMLPTLSLAVGRICKSHHLGSRLFHSGMSY